MLRKWSQITIIKSENKVRLFINGYFDKDFTTNLKFKTNEDKNPTLIFGNLSQN